MYVHTLCIFIFISNTAQTKTGNRKVNLALETSLLLEPKDVNNHLDTVNNIKTFLDQLSILLNYQPQTENVRSQKIEETDLLSLIKEFGAVLSSFSKKSIENSVKSFKNHLDNHESYRRSSYHEVFSDPYFRRIFRAAVDQIPDTDGDKVKNVVRKIRYDNYALSAIVKRLETYYNVDDKIKFKKFLKEFKNRVSQNEDPSVLIPDVLDYLIFDKYNNLNFSMKVRLLDDIRTLSEFLSGNPETRKKFIDVQLKKKALNNEKKSKEIPVHIIRVADSEVLNVKTENKIHKMNDKTANSKPNKTDSNKTELIVDNVELIVKTS